MIQKRGVTMDEVFIKTVYQIFGFTLHLYGFLIAIGILASAQTSAWLAKKRGLSENIIWDGLWWVIIPAIVGARLYHVLDQWENIYSLDPMSVFYIWNGGLGILGGLVGGVGGLLGYWKWKLPITNIQLPITNLLDVVFFGLPLGQAIGRVGNFVNQEVYGLPSSLPFAIFIDPSHRTKGFEQFTRFHPLFAYEALWCILGFFVMLLVEHRIRSDLIRSDLIKLSRRFSGFYLAWYGVGRFVLEFLRIPEFSWRIGGINMAQVFSLAMIAAGSLLLLTASRTNHRLREHHGYVYRRS